VMPGLRFAGSGPYFRAGVHYPLSFTAQPASCRVGSKQESPQSGILQIGREEVRSHWG